MEIIKDIKTLRKISDPVKSVDKNVVKLCKDLISTLLDNRAVGLAAPQIGSHKQIIAINLRAAGKSEPPFILINPKVVYRSAEQEIMEEECLSLPGRKVKVSRPKKIRVSGLTLKEQPIEIEASNLKARILLHEIDHLSGILILDWQT